MKTYLITGGAGFIGSSLCEKLIENNKIIVLDNFNSFYDVEIKERNISEFIANKNFTLYRNDIRDSVKINEIFNNHKIDVVIHLAAMAGVRPSIENPSLYQEVNCLGTQVILEAMKINGVKNGVFASSSSVYGNCNTVPFKEDMVVDYAISPYAATKKANEVLGHVYHKLYDFNIIMLRFFTVYGPKQRPDLAINKFTRQMLNNEQIAMYGDGKTSRDYTYIEDIIDGITRSINYVEKENKVYEILNLGNSAPVSLIQLIQMLYKITGAKENIDEQPMQPGDVERTYANIGKAKKIIGYEPKTSLEDGLIKFVEWYKTSTHNG